MKTSPDIAGLLDHAPWLRGLATALARRSAEADDLLQETWLAALRAPPDPAREPRPWLAQVLRNTWRMATRASGRRRDRERAMADEEDPVAASAQEVLERAQAQRRVADLVMALEEPYRTAILLHYYEGRLAKEIAAEQGIPAGTVRWRITEGLARLRTRLDAETGDADRSRALLLAIARPSSPAPRARLSVGAKPRSFIRWGVALGVAAGAAITVRALRAHHHARTSSSPIASSTVDGRNNEWHATRAALDDQEVSMKRNLKRAAALVGTALPALMASAQSGGRALTRDEQITFCVQRWERTATCKEAFAEYFSRKVPPERRLAFRLRFERTATEAGTGPLEARQQKCADSVDHIQPAITAAELQALQGCLAKPDCETVVACMTPLMDHAPAKTRVP